MAFVLLLAAGNLLRAQEPDSLSVVRDSLRAVAPPDSLPLVRDSLGAVRDSLDRTEDTLFVQPKGMIDRPAFSSARDSVMEDLEQNIIYYFGDVTASYQDMQL